KARAHMADIKQPGLIAGPFVFHHDAGGILDGEGIAAKRDHAATGSNMLRIQRNCKKVVGAGFGHKHSRGSGDTSKLRLAAEMRAPSVLALRDFPAERRLLLRRGYLACFPECLTDCGPLA